MPTRVLRSWATLLLSALVAAGPAGALVAAQESAPTPAPTAPSEVAGRVSARLERGGRVAVDNFTTGRIRVVGWDRETVEATARSERGSEAVKISIVDGAQGRRISLDTAFSDEGEFLLPAKPRLAETERLLGDAQIQRPAPAATPAVSATPQPSATPDAAQPAPAPKVVTPPGEFVLVKRRRQIDIEVRVPRYAQLDPLRVYRSPVEIEGVPETRVRVVGDRSEIRLKDVGGASVETRGGPVRVEGARWDVDVITVGGDVSVSGVRGRVSARTLSGAIEVSCVSGGVEANSVEGRVTLANLGGEVEAQTTGGDVRLSGAVREGGSYRLKSMAGRVEMSLAGPAPGFTAMLSSYTGSVETDVSREIDNSREARIDLQIQEDTTASETNRRRVGRHGDGRAQISLDSFNGPVRLTRAAPAAPCR